MQVSSKDAATRWQDFERDLVEISTKLEAKRIEVIPIQTEYKRLAGELESIEQQFEKVRILIQGWKVLLLIAELAEQGLGWCSECKRVVESQNFVWVEVIYQVANHHHESWSGTSDAMSLKHLCLSCQKKLREQYKYGKFSFCAVEVIDNRWGVRCGATNMWISALQACGGRLFGLDWVWNERDSTRLDGQIFNDLWCEYCSSLLGLDQPVAD